MHDHPKYAPKYESAPSLDYCDAMKVPVLFHDSGPWEGTKAAEWLRITGTREATTKVLCDHMRMMIRETQMHDGAAWAAEHYRALQKGAQIECVSAGLRGDMELSRALADQAQVWGDAARELETPELYAAFK